MVRKSDGSIRDCIDYRAINERTVKKSFPLPRIDDYIDILREANCITHLDLTSAYNQVRMSDDGSTDDSIATTTFQELTPSGAPCLLEMLVMRFGLCNAPPTFTRLMTHVLDPFIHLFVVVYLDDMYVYSKNPARTTIVHKQTKMSASFLFSRCSLFSLKGSIFMGSE
jgi:hypothetical protein